MAENQKVVEMFEKFLASLLGLAKKWLTDWEVDSQKLFHALQQIRKEDLVGISLGTHEIKPKATIGKVEDDDFECIFTSEMIRVPDMNSIIADCKELWGDKVGGVPVPENLKTGIQKRIKIIGNNKSKFPQEVVDHLKQYPGAVLSNVFGLRIAEMKCFSQLPKQICICGIDEKSNLSENEDDILIIPDIKFTFPNYVARDRDLWRNCRYLPDSYFVVLCD